MSRTEGEGRPGRRVGTVADVLVTVVRRLAAVVAVFAVMFAPGAIEAPSAAEPVEPAPADLSGAVLAPTFTSSELTLGRTEEAVVDGQCTDVAGFSPDTPHEPAAAVAGGKAPMRAVVDPAECSGGASSERGPPAS